MVVHCVQVHCPLSMFRVVSCSERGSHMYIVQGLCCKRPIQCLASSFGGGRTHSPGGEGVVINILEDARH